MVLCGYEVFDVQMADHGQPVLNADGSKRDALGTTRGNHMVETPEVMRSAIEAMSNYPALVADYRRIAWATALNGAFIYAAGLAAEAHYADEDFCLLLEDTIYEYDRTGADGDWNVARCALSPWIADEKARSNALWRIWRRTHDYLGNHRRQAAVSAVAAAILRGADGEGLTDLAGEHLGRPRRWPLDYPILRRWPLLARLPVAA
jgi:hypothetical protein